ncbi:adenylosuccinate synthase [Candidatus Falkowbacteria bacterium]|nr:adenylosuccinate synthase [Candidatus Falkowbacteria bacterium]
MPATAIIGVQWGDEGKGKIVDLLAQKADIVARFQGGANAGHTLVVDGKKIVLHLVPSGILHPQTICLIGPEVVVDPEILLAEIAELEANGIKCKDRLFVSNRTSLVLPYHKELDQRRENRASKKIGTTGRGIGPAYEDLVGRRAIRVASLFSPLTSLRDQIDTAMRQADPAPFQSVLFAPSKIRELNELQNSLPLIADQLQPFVMRDMTSFVNEALDADKHVLFEGAQGALLDYVNGTYPYVTSSHTHPAAICTSFGVAPQRLTKIIGIAKAYTTRVGEGPFPTELHGKKAEQLRADGAEFGATTGRPRRCGWFDRPAVEYACKISGVTEIILTKLDVLARQPNVRVNSSYQLRDKRIGRFNIEDISEYFANNEINFPDWETNSSVNARYYIQTIEGLLDIPIIAASMGAEREAMMWLK